jgi:hypothetical protein
MKSFKPEQGTDEPPADGGGRNQGTDFHGEKRSNDTHASTTDPEARLYRKGPGKEAKLCFMGHALELRGKVGDGVNQAADLISATASIPSLNFIPLTTFGNWF